MQRKRVVITVGGSVSDLPQLEGGFPLLLSALEDGRILPFQASQKPLEVQQSSDIRCGHYTLSAHRNTEELLAFLRAVSATAAENLETDYVLVMAAGWAAILPGFAAAYLCYEMKVKNVFVIGVALESEDRNSVVGDSGPILDGHLSALHIYNALRCFKQRRDLAALLSISELPGDKTVWLPENGVPLFGTKGFNEACRMAVEDEVPLTLRNAVSNVGNKPKPPAWQPWGDVINDFTPQA